MRTTQEEVTVWLGAEVRRKRESAGLTQMALAKRSGLHPSTISALERGQRPAPRTSTLQQLGTALRGDPGSLFEGIRWIPPCPGSASDNGYYEITHTPDDE